MKKEFIVNLSNISKLKDFVNEMNNYVKSDVDALYESQIIDAKSIIGVMSLSSHLIKIVIHSDNLSELAIFNTICERYEVK